MCVEFSWRHNRTHTHEKCGKRVLCRARVNLHWLAVMMYRRRRMYCAASHASHRGVLRWVGKKGASTDGGGVRTAQQKVTDSHNATI